MLWHTGGEKDSDLSCIIGKYSFMFDTLPPTGIKISPVRFFTFHQFSVMVVLSLCIYQTFNMYNPVTYTQLIRWDQWKRVVQAQTWPQCVCVGHLMNLWRWFFAFFCLAGSILLWDRMIDRYCSPNISDSVVRCVSVLTIKEPQILVAGLWIHFWRPETCKFVRSYFNWVSVFWPK